MNFRISDKDGLNYSLESGDNNKIHLNELVGYNSIFGEKICHGCLVILRIFKILNIKKLLKNYCEYSINISFSKHFSYNKKISIIKKNKTFKVSQNNQELTEITIQDKNNLNNFPCIKKHTINLNKNILNNANYKINLGILSLLLNSLTKYVGTVYPGENSIINNININFNNKFKFDDNKIKIFSKKIDKRYLFINNKLTYRNYLIEFQTSERPKLLLNNNIITSSIKKLVKKIDETILIIGASSGIGLELLNIFKTNSKISIIATYNKNNIITNKNNVNSIKLDLEKNFLILKKILKTHLPIRIYYFATPKINIYAQDNKNLKKYKNFYVRYPLKILSLLKNKKIKFFYPSTIFIKKNSSNYSKMKKMGEKMILKNINVNHEISTLRIDMVNTKQNLSFFNQNLPSFTQLLNKNREYQKKIFFIS